MNILGFGDYLMHFSPFGHTRFAQASEMSLSFTGAEANVCSALALWGENVSFVTRLPYHALADRAVASLHSFGIDTSYVARGGNRMGLYFLENGAFVRPSSVIYDRMHTAFTEATEADFSVEDMLNGKDVMVLSGITPMLSSSLRKTAEFLAKRAKERGIRIFYDVNYRPALSTVEEAGECLRSFAPYIDTLISNEEHLKMLLGIVSDYGEDDPEQRLADLTLRTKDILHINNISVTVRRTISASEAIIGAAYRRGELFSLGRAYRVGIVDRVGSGDAFTAGLIYGEAQGYTVDKAISFAVAASAYKHTVQNDVLYATVDEIHHLSQSKTYDVKR